LASGNKCEAAERAIGSFSSIGSSGLGHVATGVFGIEVLCEHAITVRTVGGQLRTPFLVHCRRNEILPLRHLHKIAAKSSIHEVSISLQGIG
jgi:hypothetical protein